VLLGDRMTRCMVELDEASGLQGSVGGGLYHLLLPGAGCRIVVGFRTERQQAGALLRSAQEHRAAGRPGQALDAIAELAHRVPHDVETLTRALSLRGKISEELAEELREIGQDLEEAQFFDTRGGFRRVVQRLDELCSSYGEANLADPRAVAALRQQAAEQLAALDGRRDDKVRARLEVMAAAFETEQRQGLAVLVRDYIGRYLPKPPDSNEPGESDREGEVK